jgi:hypothetical protein
MKKLLMILPLVAVVGMVFAFAVRPIVGTWSATYGNGAPGKVVFRSNGTYTAEFTGQGWSVSGKYKLDGNTATITDSICGFGYWARYTSKWASNDSVSFTAVTDTCSGRKATAGGMVLVRQK